MDTIIKSLHVHPSRGNRTSINVTFWSPPSTSLPRKSASPRWHRRLHWFDQHATGRCHRETRDLTKTLSFFTAKTGDGFGDLPGDPGACVVINGVKWVARPGPINWPNINISKWDLGGYFNPYKVVSKPLQSGVMGPYL